MKEKINEPIYTLTGIVIHGRGIGKHVGTPTANIEIAKNTFLPKTGVYVADILLSVLLWQTAQGPLPSPPSRKAISRRRKCPPSRTTT